MVKRKHTSNGRLGSHSNEEPELPMTDFSDSDKDTSYQPKSSSSKRKGKSKSATDKRQDNSFTKSSNAQEIQPHSKSIHAITDTDVMRSALLKWYQGVHEARGMPWRKPYNPNLGKAERAQRAYEVWISEIMLQQTQVATVIPYYNRWMEKFPTIRDLAAATIDEVNALWKGLGYYSRASRLLDGAQKAVNDFQGMLPDNAKNLEEYIPGIGRYSAGAISSIAYGEHVPVLDGNVHRLLSRVVALHANPKAKGTLDLLWSAAAAMVGSKKSGVLQHAGDVNQALIELGSTVCKVRDPDCKSCPLQSWCSAYKISATSEKYTKTDITDIEDLCRLCEPFTGFEGVTSYPMKVERKKAREELDIVNVIEWRSKQHPDNRQFLMVRRPAGGLLAGLYEFPSFVNVPKNLDLQSQSDLPKTSCSHHFEGDHPSFIQVQVVGDVPHVFSHIKKTYRVQWAILEDDQDTPPTLITSPDEEPEPPAKRFKARRSGKSTTSNQTPTTPLWVPLDEVTNTNMGTGVVKIWSLTKALWESKTN